MLRQPCIAPVLELDRSCAECTFSQLRRWCLTQVTDNFGGLPVIFHPFHLGTCQPVANKLLRDHHHHHPTTFPLHRKQSAKAKFFNSAEYNTQLTRGSCDVWPFYLTSQTPDSVT
jgi:hypothetical protein